jgi:hypothetical protein
METATTPPSAPAMPKRHPLIRALLLTLAAVLILIIALAGVVATQPSDFVVTRKMTMNAPPEAVFAQLNSFHNWNDWSPWAKLDPNAIKTYLSKGLLYWRA